MKDSQWKLQRLVEACKSRAGLVQNSAEYLESLLLKSESSHLMGLEGYEGSSGIGMEGIHSEGPRGGETCDENKNESDVMLYLLWEIECSLQMMHTEDRHETLKLVNAVLNGYIREKYGRGLSEHIEIRLHMLFDSNDSIYLLDKKYTWIVREVYNVVHRDNVPAGMLEQHPQCVSNSIEFLQLFQCRLLQWQRRANAVRQLYLKLKDMLQWWPQFPLVRTICILPCFSFKSLVRGRNGCHFELVNFKHKLRTDVLRIQINLALGWIPEYLVDGKLTFVQAMAW